MNIEATKCLRPRYLRSHGLLYFWNPRAHVPLGTLELHPFLVRILPHEYPSNTLAKLELDLQDFRRRLGITRTTPDQKTRLRTTLSTTMTEPTHFSPDDNRPQPWSTLMTPHQQMTFTRTTEKIHWPSQTRWGEGFVTVQMSLASLNRSQGRVRTLLGNRLIFKKRRRTKQSAE